MRIEELFEAVKTECERAIRVLKKHAKGKALTEDNVQSMRFFRDTALGKLHGMIDISIIMSAKEYVNDDNRYWEKVSEIRSYEEEKESEISDIYNDWYYKHLTEGKAND